MSALEKAVERANLLRQMARTVGGFSRTRRLASHGGDATWQLARSKSNLSKSPTYDARNTICPPHSWPRRRSGLALVSLRAVGGNATAFRLGPIRSWHVTTPVSGVRLGRDVRSGRVVEGRGRRGDQRRRTGLASLMASDRRVWDAGLSLHIGGGSGVRSSTDCLEVLGDSSVLAGELVLVAERGGGRVVAEAMHDGAQRRAAGGGERRIGVT